VVNCPLALPNTSEDLARNFENSAYGLNLMRELTSLGVRRKWTRGRTLSRRVKRAYDDGVPYILVVGKREVEGGNR